MECVASSQGNRADRPSERRAQQASAEEIISAEIVEGPSPPSVNDGTARLSSVKAETASKSIPSPPLPPPPSGNRAALNLPIPNFLRLHRHPRAHAQLRESTRKKRSPCRRGMTIRLPPASLGLSADHRLPARITGFRLRSPSRREHPKALRHRLARRRALAPSRAAPLHALRSPVQKNWSSAPGAGTSSLPRTFSGLPSTTSWWGTPKSRMGFTAFYPRNSLPTAGRSMRWGRSARVPRAPTVTSLCRGNSSILSRCLFPCWEFLPRENPVS